MQFHQLDAKFTLAVVIDGVDVFPLEDSFQQQVGKGKGLAKQLEECSFEAVFFEDTVEVTPEFAELFQSEYGTTVLFEYLGQEADISSKLTGSVWLKFPGK